MFKNKNIEFWFWVILAFINIFVIIASNHNSDSSTVALGYCMLALCFAKSLICAMELESKD